MPTIRQAVLRTLATGALMLAVVPPLAVWSTRPQPVTSIVLKASVTPVHDNPTMVAR
ncbi:MAG: hypothetical protein H0W70_07115 [Actinobacteria bacterium]|nr:hypothetical protein [Actinomycetota bacterium]